MTKRYVKSAGSRIGIFYVAYHNNLHMHFYLDLTDCALKDVCIDFNNSDHYSEFSHIGSSIPIRGNHRDDQTDKSSLHF